jgi:cytochrome P450
MGYFLGLDEQSFRALQASMPRQYYEFNAMEAVSRFFTAYMGSEGPAASESSMKHFLLGAVEAGEISHQGATDLMVFFWMAGIMTTTLHLTNLVYELLTRPDVAGELRRDSGLVPAFIGECLRLNPPGVQVMRVSTRDTVLGGKTIPAGSLVIAGMMAANRDPAVFSQAEEMLLDRPARRDFAFGGGIHYCMGHHLAKREAQAVVNGVLPLLDRLQLDPAAPLRAHFLLDFYGMVYLPVRWR